MKPLTPRTLTRILALTAMAMASTPTQAAPPLACLIQPSRIAEVGTSVTGVIDELRVERGDSVKKGQVIAVLRGDVERAALGVAKSRAQADADVQAALAALEFARQNTVRTEGLVQKKFVSEQALDKVRTEEKVAAQRLAQAREQRQISAHEQNLAQSQLAQRTIVSPIGGIVAERYLSTGERVEERSVARVVSINPLHVEVMVPAAEFGKLKPGQTAMVTPELPGVAPAEARIVLVDKLIDGASNTFRVRLELPNPDHAIPAGPRCKVAFGDLAVGAAKTASAPRLTPMPGISRAVYAVPAAAADSGVAGALERWRAAWESKDLIGYLAAYTGDFRGESASRADWIKQREARIQKPGPLDIRISDTRIKPLAGNQVRVQFRQQYQAGSYRADTVKSLLMVQEKGQWLIKEERASP